MTEENMKLEEALGNAQPTVPDEPVEAPVEEAPVEEAPAEKTVEEAPASEELPEEKKEEQPKAKKEKKPCKLVAYFANAKNAGDLVKKCFLMLLLAVVLAYVLGLMFWGFIDKMIPTFYNGAYWAVGTAGAFLLAGLVLIIVMISRFVKQNKKKK